MKGRPKSTYNPKKKNWYCDDLEAIELFKKKNPGISVSEFINRQIAYEAYEKYDNIHQQRVVILRRINVLSTAKTKEHEKVDIKFDKPLRLLIKKLDRINKKLEVKQKKK